MVLRCFIVIWKTDLLPCELRRQKGHSPDHLQSDLYRDDHLMIGNYYFIGLETYS